MMINKFTKNACLVLGGTVIIVGSASFIIYVRHALGKLKRSRNIEDPIGNEICIEDLRILTRSPNTTLRRSAEELLIDRITQRSSFSYVLHACYSSDIEQTYKGCTVLCLILKGIDYMWVNLDCPVIETLGFCLLRTVQPRTDINQFHLDYYQEICIQIQRKTLAAILDMFCNSENEVILFEVCPFFIELVLQIILHTQFKEVRRCGIFIIHQMSIEEYLVKEILEKNALEIVAIMTRRNHGDSIIQSLCLQMLVTLLSAPQQDLKTGLEQIAGCGILMPTVACLNSDNQELVFWAAALIHEFSFADVLRNDICEIPFLIKNLQKALQKGGEAPLQRLVLRIICFLALHNDKFKQSLITQRGLIEHIPVCLGSGEKEVIHWSLVLVHDIAMLGKLALENLLNFTNDKIITSIMSVMRIEDTVILRLLAETLGFFCSCETLHCRVVKAGALSGIIKFSEMLDPDLIFWSAALLLNLAMTSDEVKIRILQAGGLHTLMELALGEYENSQVTTMAAKTLAMMGYVEGALQVQVYCDVDIARVTVSDKQYNFDTSGINVMMWDTLHSRESVRQSFNAKPYGAIPFKIPCLEEAGPNAIGNLVFILIQGEYGPQILKNLNDTLKFSEHTSVTGTLTSDLLTLPVNQVCVVVSILEDDKKLDVRHISKSPKAIDLQLQFPYDHVVKNRVLRLVIEPEVKLLLSISLTSPISRASSLELLEILARPENYNNILLEHHDLLQHLTSPIWYCSKKGLEESQGEPVRVAHCVGALKLLVVLSVHDVCRRKMLLNDTVNAIKSLLYELTSIWLTSSLEGSLAPNRAFSRTGQESNAPSSLYFSEARHDSLADSISVDSIQDTISTISSIIQTYRPVAMVAGTRADDQSREGVDAEDSRMSEIPGGFPQSEHADVYTSLTLHSIQLLTNLLGIQDKELFKVVQMMLIKGGVFHLLWALLLLSQDNLKNSISLAISSTLSQLSAVDITEIDNNTVRLDLVTKTAALIVSANALEVRNYSWTFESILANIPVPSQGTNLPMGWYFEVELRSSGIVQIGWATKKSALEPEKGIGVGDDTESYAFDGARCKIWSGPITENMSNDYGMEWNEGDIISCVIDRHGNISYWLRGLNMGVAFKNVDLKRCFYPACSLSTNQEIAFNFGDREFRYGNLMPVGYVAYREIISPPVSFSSRYHDVPGTSWWIPFQKIDDEDAFDKDEDFILTDEFEDETLIEGVNGCGEEMAIINNEDDETLNSLSEMGAGGEKANDERQNQVTAGGVCSSLLPDLQADVHERRKQQLADNIHISEGHAFYDDNANINSVALENEEQPKESIQDNDNQQPIIDMQCLLEDNDQPEPSLYFEVVVTADSPKSVAIGYTDIDGMDQVCVVYNSNGTLQFPDSTNIQCRWNGNTTIGCGLLLPPGAIFFTVNGQPIKKLFSFAKEETAMSPLVPITNTRLLDLNFGSRLFLYSPANQLEQKLSMAALLHDFQKVKETESDIVTEQMENI